MTVLESILQSLRNAASYNQHELAAPHVTLWPDEERLWTKCIEPIRALFPDLWSLGEYSSENATGPAAWLRYQLSLRKTDYVPVIYLPGIGRAAFRSADQCPDQAKHLFALQFQGQFWTQRNGKDWTPFAFLSSAEGGVGLDVAADQETKKAINECLRPLIEVHVDDLRGGKLEAVDFRAIVTKDPDRTLLKWMTDPSKATLRMQKSDLEWASFRAVCRDKYHFDPDKDGTITAAEKLTSGKGAWVSVWERYKEAPRAYPGIKNLLESLPAVNLFEAASEYKPLSNRKEEERLEKELLALSSLQPKEVLIKLSSLSAEHAHRATWVWAELGDSPLARAIRHLGDLAETIQLSGSPTYWEAISDYYSSEGWKVDRSVLRAFNGARPIPAAKAVTAAIQAAYLPWLEKFSSFAQSQARTYPTNGPKSCRNLPAEDGTVYLFADGLRMDLARSLEENLLASATGVSISFDICWSALPTVTATAKPAWMPLAAKLGGPLDGAAFQSKEKSTGKALNQARFKQLLEELGISFLEPDAVGSPSGCAWTEFGSVDTFGHEQGAKLAWRIDEELTALQQRIIELSQAGWNKVKVVTDHGWLMVPGGLPKIELPKHLAASRWSRCAVPEQGAQHGYPVTSWFWDSAEAVVLATGVSCFVSGMEYAHGGLTMQEALIPSLTITAAQTGGAKTVVLKEMKWVGLRLNVVLEGAQGLTVDIRSKVADSKSSFAATSVLGAASGQKTSLLVVDDDASGVAAFLVVVDETGQPIFKHPVVVGEN